MATQKQIQLVNMLIEKTNQGRLEWKPGVDDGSFQLSFANSSVEIYARRNRTGDEDIVIAMRNGFGEVVDMVSDVDLDKDETYAILSELGSE